jgi:hypothetical protein|tara:strand:+ start:1724 stop:2221 length:498 start_codon:yes stop_codon:yes gene_type:complete
MKTIGEASRLVHMTDQLLSEMLNSLADMSEETLNMDMDIPEANSLYVLARHVLGSVEEWGLYFGTGYQVQRDRDSEFMASGQINELIEYKNSWMPLLQERAAMIENEQLNNQGWRPEPDYKSAFPSGAALSIGDALLHTVDHTAVHLGHLQLTKQLIEHQAIRRL